LKLIHSRREIEAVRASCFVMGLLLSFGRFGTKLAVCISIVSYVLQNDSITAEEVRPSSPIYFVTVCVYIHIHVNHMLKRSRSEIEEDI
jgi:hypothetical protein